MVLALAGRRQRGQKSCGSSGRRALFAAPAFRGRGRARSSSASSSRPRQAGFRARPHSLFLPIALVIGGRGESPSWLAVNVAGSSARVGVRAGAASEKAASADWGIGAGCEGQQRASSQTGAVGHGVGGVQEGFVCQVWDGGLSERCWTRCCSVFGRCAPPPRIKSLASGSATSVPAPEHMPWGRPQGMRNGSTAPAASRAA